MTPNGSQDALPASTVGYDPSDPVRSSARPASDQSGVAERIEENTPVLDSIDPDTGLEAGGEEITLTGSHLSGAADVKFGSESATFTVDDDETITATAPAGTEGAVDVKVVLSEAMGFESEGVEYTYTAAP